MVIYFLVPVRDTWAVVNGQAVLPCDVSTTSTQDSPLLIVISKGSTPIYR